MKSVVDKIQEYYKAGIYKVRHLNKLVEAGAITEAQKQEIMGI